LIPEYGQEQFYHIELSVLENYHMITVQNMFEI